MYILRLDDAAPSWNKGNWQKIHGLLERYGIKPIVAIIPNNNSEELLRYREDPDYLNTIKQWIGQGWTPALHGNSHMRLTNQGGINPVNGWSEFAGLPLADQKIAIREGYTTLLAAGIHPVAFAAPAHTFDRNTVVALKEETDIRVISDTVAANVYCKDGMYYIPQQSGRVRRICLPVVTFCYHPNTMEDREFIELETFIKKHRDTFKSFEDIKLVERPISITDRLLRSIYFFRHKMVSKTIL